MKILAIETSCDETAISVIEASGKINDTHFEICGNKILSQIALHQKYGGVYPSLAKREHAKNLVPVLTETLKESNLLNQESSVLDIPVLKELEALLTREPELFKQLTLFFNTYKAPKIDAIAVTYGPGLEPALWVGINFAKALADIWKVKIIPVNHMEGHIFAGLLKKTKKNVSDITNIDFPILALLVSGGHTELALMKKWSEYKIIGSTQDDAVGEAFDKVARILGLPYPGGPEISRLAQEARDKNLKLEQKLPRPMINSDNLNFSFSGLKTAVLYLTQKINLNTTNKKKIAREFEDAAVEVLIEKTIQAIKIHSIKTLVIGGGVSANIRLRKNLTERIRDDFPKVALSIPENSLTTDNAIMIGVAGYYNSLYKEKKLCEDIIAEGHLTLS